MQAQEQIRHELLSMIEHRMDSIHRLYARHAGLRNDLDNSAPVEGVHNQLAIAAMILKHVLELHLDDVERDWSVLDEQVCPIAQRARRAVG